MTPPPLSKFSARVVRHAFGCSSQPSLKGVSLRWCNLRAPALTMALSSCGLCRCRRGTASRYERKGP